MKYTIYKIYCTSKPEVFYIGSTTRFSGRKSHHKKNVTNRVGKRYWTRLYVYIRDNGGWDNFTIESIENGECDNKDFYRKKEQEYIDNLKPDLNSIRVISKNKVNLISIDNI